MGEIVNLRRARKAVARRAAEEAAAQARVTHGTPKAVRQRAEAQRTVEDRRLDAHRREGPERDPSGGS